MEVKIYTIPTCPWCGKLKEWLKAKKVSFQELEIEESSNSNYRDELINKTGQVGVPVIDIDGEIIIGFNEKKIEEALNKAKDKEES